MFMDSNLDTVERQFSEHVGPSGVQVTELFR